ncbi:hypothetical protein [Mesorhizobium sp. Root157]|uniref:hypothetical protein n=1 Tax=Mesorhizobium sp. Root157 TaxID=1736477 RepID=UPI001FCD8C58|nr:hypothetical protein [Mesorhizobium sp. Root157]
MAACFVAIVIAMPAAAQVKDFLSVPGPLEFDGKSYGLAWSGQPTANYVKQEYVPAGQKVETYAQMLLVEVVTGEIKVMDAVRSQVDALNKRKASDPLVNISLVENKATGEALLDFIASTKGADGEYIVEWNAYRYAPYRGGAKTAGVLLYAVSHRAYGNQNAKTFLGGLKQFRQRQINALAKADLPAAKR